MKNKFKTEIKCCNPCGFPVEKLGRGEIVSSWRDGKSAPKNGNAFLADIGYGFAVVAAWNGYEGHFVYASLAAGEMALGKHDLWFETEWCDVVVKRWMPMPGISNA